MQRNGVPYILGFCGAICLVCAIVVSSTAVGLKERQETNKVLDRQKKVLAVAGLLKDGEAVTPEHIQSVFKKRIKAVIVDLKTGKEDAEATKNAGDFDQKKAQKDPATSSAAPKNRAGVKRVPNQALVYQVSTNDMGSGGSGFKLGQYIFPVEGKGLWSTLYGFLAVAPDGNTVKGITFYEHGETPGLGGEVDNPSWKSKWPDRMIFGPKGSSAGTWGDVQLKVKKGIAGSPAEDPHQVDGLSGATITANGVTYLVQFWLGDNGFGPYIRHALGQAG